MRIDLITIFPDYFAPLALSLVGKAITGGTVELGVHDLRQWTHDVHRSVDDTPFGGGAGMVMKAEPWGEALDALLEVPGPVDNSDPAAPPAAAQPELTPAPDQVRGRDGQVRGRYCDSPRRLIVFPSPSGRLFNQELASQWAGLDHLIIGCGRYEGIDARVAQYAATKAETVEVSLGDYVLNGGEVAALAMIEAVVRLLPGVVGNPDSLVEESHSPQWRLLEYPVYTKPANWRGYEVPPVLLSGHHAQIARWRAGQAEQLTRRRRPELLEPEPVEPDAI